MTIPTAASPRLILDEHLARTAIAAVQGALATMFGVRAVPGPYSLQKDFVSHGDISGILGMVQERMEGTLVVSFEKATIFGILKRVYGREFSEVDSSVRQGVGELTNIIYSSMKKALNERGHSFKMAIPNVVIGSSHSIINLHEGQTMVVPFSVEGGSFYVEIAMQPASH
jgi:chemotaxis protein CheX